MEIRIIGKYNPQNTEKESNTNTFPRLLRVKMTDTRLKLYIIKNGNGLKELDNESTKKLWIVSDLTRKEREERKG